MSFPNVAHNYDYIFTGAGCAALSLLMRMIQSGRFSDKQILLIDNAPKITNDRTWCFWEKEDGFFENIVYRKWDRLKFYGDEFSSSPDISPYRYKMIRGIDFYNYCFEKIKHHRNIAVKFGNIRFDKDSIFLDDNLLPANNAIVFNSIYQQPANVNNVIYLRQHFKGIVIETSSPSFNAAEAILMDFRVHQDFGTSFSYVLPFNESKALIEYTQFTEEILPVEQYDEELKKYIRDILRIENYKKVEEEFGVIPMTNAKFTFRKNGRYNIGTAGGQTKGSSGYTFRFIQKHAEAIMKQLLTGRPLQETSMPARRFHFYDTVLLRLLKENRLKGKEIFRQLFERNKSPQIFKFLDNETSIPEELRIISSLPFLPFLKAAIK